MTRIEGWPAIALIAFHVTHYLCVAVWIGAMFFNLIVGFPLMWKRSNSIDRYREAMAAQE